MLEHQMKVLLEPSFAVGSKEPRYKKLLINRRLLRCILVLTRTFTSNDCVVNSYWIMLAFHSCQVLEANAKR